MKQITTTFIMAILSLACWAQNCGTIQPPFTLPQGVCNTEDPIFLAEIQWGQNAQFELYGDGVVIEQTTGGAIYYFDPSEIELNGDNVTPAVINYGAYDDCEQWQNIATTLLVNKCDCDPLRMPVELPSEACNDDDNIFLGSYNESITSNGILTQGPNGWEIDPSSNENSEVTITYVVSNDCNEFETFVHVISFSSCQNCDDPVIDLGQSMCNTDNPVVIASASGSDIYGPGITYTHDGVVFDPGADEIDAPTIVTIGIAMQDDCGEWHQWSQTVFIEDCSSPCFEAQLPGIENEICNTDDPMFLLYSGDLWIAPAWLSVEGPGVTFDGQGGFGQFVFDPSEVDAGAGYYVVYHGVNSCMEEISDSVYIYVNDCDQQCGTVGRNIQLPQQMCNTDQRVFITETGAGTGGFEVWGDGVVAESNGSLGITIYYFDPSEVTPGYTEVHYGAYNDCQEWVVVTYVIFVDDCTISNTKDVLPELQFSTYPTVINEQGAVQVESLETLSLKVVNMLGEVVLEASSEEGIHVSHLTAGNYVIIATAPNGSTGTSRLIIQ